MIVAGSINIVKSEITGVGVTVVGVAMGVGVPGAEGDGVAVGASVPVAEGEGAAAGTGVPVVEGEGVAMVTVGVAAEGTDVVADVGVPAVAARACSVAGGDDCAAPILVKDGEGESNGVMPGLVRAANGVSVNSALGGDAITSHHISSKSKTSANRTRIIPVTNSRLRTIASYTLPSPLILIPPLA